MNLKHSILPTLTRYLRIWRKAAVLNFTILVAARVDFWTFIPSKLIRMGFFFLFALSIFRPGTIVAGYTSEEALMFFAFMNLTDVLLQLFYRGLTDHPRIIKNGDFDFVLTKPLNPLFWSTFRIFDLLDLVTVPATLGLLGYALWQWPGEVGAATWVLVILLLACGFVMALCINIMIASAAFWTTETQNIWWTYRDLVYVSRFPPETFPRAVRLVLTYLIPVFVIVSYPTKALLQRLTYVDIMWTFVAMGIIMWLTKRVWEKGLRHYTSASS